MVTAVEEHTEHKQHGHIGGQTRCLLWPSSALQYRDDAPLCIVISRAETRL